VRRGKPRFGRSLTLPYLLLTRGFLTHLRARGRRRWRRVVLCATCQKGKYSEENWKHEIRYCPVWHQSRYERFRLTRQLKNTGLYRKLVSEVLLGFGQIELINQVIFPDAILLEFADQKRV
jgi:hypothetical protein